MTYAEMSREEREAFCVPRWIDGKSASEIADMLPGATRNAVIGVVHRSPAYKAFKKSLPQKRASNLPKPQFGGRRTTPKAPPNSPGRKPTPKIGGVKFTGPKKLPKPKPEREPAEDTSSYEAVRKFINGNRDPLPGVVPVALIDLPSREHGVCRFPVVGGYCGLTCGDARYCPDHHAIMFNRPQKAASPDQVALARQKYKAKRERALAGLAVAIEDGE
jgi:hypothetical protein